MCGIAGYIGNKSNTKDYLLNSLKALEYRGYDSAGIATLQDGEITVTKSEGKISNLEKILDLSSSSTCGIAHTRWATHGAPTFENAHPHLSNDKSWGIVHNGIIENFHTIKDELKKHNFFFKSQTDTEVVCNLLQHNYNKNALCTLIKTSNSLQGSFALVCMHKDYPNTLFLAKNKSPLYVAISEGEVLVASDTICFLNKAKAYYCLQDGEFCKADANSLTFYNSSGKIIQKEATQMSSYDISNSKQQFNYYMEKEINEVPKILNNIIKVYTEQKVLEPFDKKFISKYNKIVLIGCGTAYHASLMGAKYITEIAKVDANAYIASEYRYSSPVLDKNTLCILVSQSGETADTLAVCELAKEAKATTIALTNVLYSTLAKSVNHVLPVCAGTEIAVASTKAYSAQISVLYMFAKHLQNVLHDTNNDFIAEMENLSKKMRIPTTLEVTPLAQILASNNKVIVNNVFFIGRHYDYVTALEAGLKLKEITYIPCSEHPAGELKHGFLALVDRTSILFVIATNKSLLEKTLSGAFEALARGAKVVFVTQFALPQETTDKFFMYIKLPENKDELMPIASISYFQKLAFETSITKGLNPDQPRNLAKSVTVE